MENVLAAFVTIFLFLSSVLTLSGVFLSSQDLLRASWQEMQARADMQIRTHLSVVGSQAINSTDVLEVTYRNEGGVKLADFGQWDAFVEYADSSDPAAYHIDRLSYAAGTPARNEWTVEGMYLDAQHKVAETVEPGVLNPGEDVIVQIRLASPIGIGRTIQFTLTTPNGVSTSALFTPDAPPVLAANTGLAVAKSGSSTIANVHLSVTDADDQPGDLVYTITTAPTQGALSLGNTFTQLAIDNGLLKYTRTGLGAKDDSFAFTVSDGKTTIGQYTFSVSVMVGEPPVLMANTGLPVAGGQTTVIDRTRLVVTDADDLPGNLVYTVTRPPTRGTLNLGNTFTQAAIDSGSLSYTRADDGNDGFTFTISDSQTTIGPHTFTITQP